MGGSASIASKEINMFGHDGLMGSNGPIGVGACFATNHPTIVFLGDAAAEEDYVLGGLGWASTKNIPLITVVEDNNLSILTEKKVRRNWEMSDVAKSFKMEGFNLNDFLIMRNWMAYAKKIGDKGVTEVTNEEIKIPKKYKDLKRNFDLNKP